MRRNIKRTLPGLNVVSFSGSSPSPVRKRLELATVESMDDTSNESSTRLLAQGSEGTHEEINQVNVLNTSVLFEFHTKELSENDSDSDKSDEDENTQTSTHDNRKLNTAKNWESIRYLLRDVVIESECIPIGQACTACNTAPATFRCLKCGSGIFFCEPCVLSQHRNICLFHVVEQWKDGMFLPITIVGRVLDPRTWHCCSAKETKSITAICENGLRHDINVISCPCEPFPVSLARLKLWPTSSKYPKLALSFELLDWMEALLLECQVSVNDFCKAVNTKMPKYVIKKDIYPLIIDCFEEYRFMKHELRTLKTICPDRDYGTVCPACPVDSGVLIESFDASFGLPRKKSSGSSARKPLHGNEIFLSQEVVDKFVEEYPTQPASPKDCNDFKAGDILRSKTQFKALDETGVFGRACRHGFPKQFVNLKHGERIAYSVWMLKSMIEKGQEGNYDVKVMYDIGCVLAKHLRASGQTDLLNKVTLAVPTFHIYGHKAACQLEYSPRRVLGFGLSDGEQCERLWSFLRRFSKMTKEMRPSHRIDVLSDAILHYGRNCKDKLVSGLLRNWRRSEQCIEASTKNMEELSNKSPVPLSAAIIEELAHQEKSRICGNRPTRDHNLNDDESDASNSWVSSYVDVLRKYYTLRSHMCADDSITSDELLAITKKIDRLDKELQSIETTNSVSSRWTPDIDEYKKQLESKIFKQCSEIYQKIKTVCEERLFLLKLKEKYSEGHALSKKLANQVKKTDKKIKELLLAYNSSREQLSMEAKTSFQELTLDNAKRHETFNIDETVIETNAIPSSIKRHAIEMLNLLKRSKEEKELLSREMEGVYNYYLKEEAKVSKRIDVLSSNALNRYEAGSLALLKAEHKILQNRIVSIHYSLKDCVALPDVPFSTDIEPVSFEMSFEVDEANDSSDSENDI